MLARWFYRTPFALKFAVVGLAIAGPLLVTAGVALASFHGQVRDFKAVEAALVKADLIRTLVISIARHRGLSASVLAGGEDVSSQLVDEQRNMLPQFDAVLAQLNGPTLRSIGLPDPAGLKADLQLLTQLPMGMSTAENFERHNAVVSALLGASARLGQGLALAPAQATENDVVFVRLPMLLEELGRQRGWGSAILTQQQASPEDTQTYLLYAGATARRLELLRADPATLARLDRLHGGLGQPMQDALLDAEGFFQRSLRAVAQPRGDDEAGRRHFADGTATIELLANVNQTLVAARRAAAEAALHRARTARAVAMAGLLAALGLLLLLYREFSRSTVGRLQALGQSTRHLAASDFDRPIGVEGSDEIAQLGQALEAARLQLRNAVAERARGLAAQQADRAKTEFLARWSHDLRTPLNAVLGFADLIEGRPGARLSEAQRLDLQRIRQAGQHLLRLVNDVLDITRIEASEVELHLAAHDLREATIETLALLQPQAEAAAVSLRLQAAAPWPAPDAPDSPPAAYGSTPRVLADRTRLLQVLGHLLGNAIRYNRPGGQVEVKLRQRPEAWGVEVLDTGPGLGAERLATLFEPFGQPGSDARAGSGLGLPLSRRLARLMGGDIEVATAPGEGSAFTLWLQAAPVHLPVQPPLDPLGTGAHPGLPQDAGETRAAGAAMALRDLPGGRLAYVEDDPVNALLVREMLAGVPGLELQVFDTAAAALAAAAAGARFDLWLVDKQLPDGDGVQLLGQLNALAAAAGQPPLHAVMLSADALPGSVAPARAAGFVAYWTKPVALHTLRQGVAAELGKVGSSRPAPPPGPSGAGLATISGSGEPLP